MPRRIRRPLRRRGGGWPLRLPRWWNQLERRLPRTRLADLMDWLIVSLLGLVLVSLACLAAWLIWRRADEASRGLVRRIARLPWRAKLRLALGLARGPRLPPRPRPPA